MTTVVLEHLQHANSGSPDLTVGPDGNIGIGGVAAPSANLEIKPTGADGELKITSDANGGNNMRLIQGYNSYINASNNVYISAGGNPNMFNLVNGRVGIKNTSPIGSLRIDSSAGAFTTSTTVSDYQLNLFQEGVSTGEGAGLAFTIFASGDLGSYPTYTPGAAITHERVGGNSQGGLRFKVKPTTIGTDPMRDAMNIDYLGRVQVPYQPGFSSYKNGTQTEQSGDIIITSWTENFDEGGNFDAPSGRFTAPIAGKYLLMLSCMHSGLVNGDLQFRIFINGAYYQGSNDTADGSSWDQCTVVTIAYLNVGDYVDPIVYSNNTSTREVAYNNRYTGWHGYLLG